MDFKDKKAIVVGGSNGIGLSFSINLINKGYYVYIVDKVAPVDLTNEYSSKYQYINCDLNNFNEDIFSSLSKKDNVEILFISAGFGRISQFENFHISEIEKTFTVNTVSIIKILRIFYSKIKSNSKFYCGVMVSIAGLISSPCFSLYAATKAALHRFIESINIELECSYFENRILEVSPGSFTGSRFSGGDNDLKLMDKLSLDIIENLFLNSVLFIPQYEEVYKDVLKRYYSDSHEFGLQSYKYKLESGRLNNVSKIVIGYLSGTFDLFHTGHLNLLKRAKDECDYLIVGVHPDASHKNKETFISFEDRKAIVGAVKYVDKVVTSCQEDSEAWGLWHFNKLFVGSDYKNSERFNRYEKCLKDKGVEIVYFPYTKSISSTYIRQSIVEKWKNS